MSRRAAGSSPSPWIAATIDSSSPPSTAWPTPHCRSRSLDIVAIGAKGGSKLIGLDGFADKQVEGWQMAIPFDQRRPAAETAQAFTMECPDLIGHRTAMIVNQHDAIADGIGVMPGEVIFADCLGGQRRQIGSRIEAEITAADVDVVDVAEEPAARALRQRRQKFCFRYR